MKILILSDRKHPHLYEHFDKKRFKDVGMVISCGDLPKYYLDFIIDSVNVPCFMVPGNHDQYLETSPPMGWVNLHEKRVEFEGIRMMGFGGSPVYNYESPYQYSEFQMKMKYLKQCLPFNRQKNRLDILVTHSPAEGLGDNPNSHVHKGFKTFRTILDTEKPRFHFYGHYHMNYGAPRNIEFGPTSLWNAFEYYIVDFDAGKNNSII